MMMMKYNGIILRNFISGSEAHFIKKIQEYKRQVTEIQIQNKLLIEN